MMSGLRSQRDRMMTWVSLRSGVASSGRCIIDHVPQRHAAATNAKIKYLLRTEKVMRRLIILPPRRRVRSASQFFLQVLGRVLLEFFVAFVGTEDVGFAAISLPMPF